jgi:hypothetical protein
MKSLQFVRQWRDINTGRSCGTCYTCCVWLGIEELKKWTGQACKHLDGKNPEGRCSIYEHRPKACRDYHCMWRAGWGPEGMRPDQSGLLITVYSRDDSPGKAAATVIITDWAKAKPLIDKVALELLMIDIITEVRVINYATKMALLYKDGQIFHCQLLPPENYEELHFKTQGVPIARYLVKDPANMEFENADSGEQGSS